MHTSGKKTQFKNRTLLNKKTTFPKITHTSLENSAFQTITHSPALISYVLDCKEFLGERKKAPLAYTVHDLVEMMWSSPYKSYLNPSNMLYVIERYSPLFKGYQQQDSQEYLLLLLDKLHEELASLTPCYRHLLPSIMQQHRHSSQENTNINTNINTNTSNTQNNSNNNNSNNNNNNNDNKIKSFLDTGETTSSGNSSQKDMNIDDDGTYEELNDNNSNNNNADNNNNKNNNKSKNKNKSKSKGKNNNNKKKSGGREDSSRFNKNTTKVNSLSGNSGRGSEINVNGDNNDDNNSNGSSNNNDDNNDDDDNNNNNNNNSNGYDDSSDNKSGNETEKEKELKYRSHSIISDLFEGMLRSTVTCCSCSQKSLTYDDFYLLSLPIAARVKNIRYILFCIIAAMRCSLFFFLLHSSVGRVYTNFNWL